LKFLFRPSVSASMAFGWSPVGLKSDVSLNLSEVLLNVVIDGLEKSHRTLFSCHSGGSVA